MPRLVEPTDEAIVEAARQLRRGAMVVFPTETVYGLGADTFNPEAIDAVYALKGRPPDMPLIAHVYDSRQARELVAVWDDRCERLVERFWPGPLTLVLPRADHLPDRATAGGSTIAVRAPAHPVARKLIGGFDGPISAPSANRSGDRSPTRAGHVVADLAEFEDLMVLDGGPCAVGIESTVLDLTPEGAPEAAPADRPSPPRVLRLGGVSREEIQDVVGLIVDSSPATHDASARGAAAPDAPRTPTELLASHQLRERMQSAGEPLVALCFDPDEIETAHRSIKMPRSARAYGARLYDALREAEAMRPARIIIERPRRTDGLWAAIHDRLRRVV